MDTFGSRLVDLINQRGSSNEKLANVSGLTTSAISQWRTKQGVSPKALPLLKIADELGTSVRYLLTGEGPMFTDSDFDPESEVRVPVSTYKFSAGPGAANPWEDTGETLTFRREWMRKHRYSIKDLVIAKIVGNSMEKTLFDGDSIAINKGMTDPLHDHVYAISFEEHFFVKRLMIEPNKWSFISDNPDNGKNKDIILIGGERNLVHIEGRVVHRMGDGGL